MESKSGGQPRHEIEIAQAQLPIRVCPEAVFEAFPNLFLGFLCEDMRYPRRSGRNWTDRLFPLVWPRLLELVGRLLPERKIEDRPLTNHDEIAAFVCAVTGLCCAAGSYAAVGSAEDGYIVLPPRWAWPSSAPAGGPWPGEDLARSLARRDPRFPGAELREA